MKNIIQARFEEHLEVANAVMQSDILEQIERIATVVKSALTNGKKVLFFLMAVALLIANIWLQNSLVAFRKNVKVCLLSHLPLILLY